MSLGGADPGTGTAVLRAMAHPVRLRIMSLLTGAPLTAAEIARELGLTHANASYHLRNLLAAGLIVPAGEEKIRGGMAKRYRYDAARVQGPPLDPSHGFLRAIADELMRRTETARWDAPRVIGDADLWIDAEHWTTLHARMKQLVHELHEVAQPPRSPGTVRTSTTVVMFQMEAE